MPDTFSKPHGNISSCHRDTHTQMKHGDHVKDMRRQAWGAEEDISKSTDDEEFKQVGQRWLC